MKRVRLAIALLAAAGIADAVYLAWLKIQFMTNGGSCGFGGCDVVNQSPYATLFGVPVALFGALTYAALFGLALLWYDARGRLARWLGWGTVLVSGWGFLFSAYLTGIELFVLDAICPFCVVSAVIMTLILILAIVAVRQTSAG